MSIASVRSQHISQKPGRSFQLSGRPICKNSGGSSELAPDNEKPDSQII